MLARADYFVASYNSKWSKLVEWLRYGLYQKDRSSSVDASADHADLFTVIYGLFNNKVGRLCLDRERSSRHTQGCCVLTFGEVLIMCLCRPCTPDPQHCKVSPKMLLRMSNSGSYNKDTLPYRRLPKKREWCHATLNAAT